MSKNRLRVAIVGAGMIKFGELFNKSFEDMLVEAYQDCINSVDNGIDENEIEAAWLSTCQGSLIRKEILSGFSLSEPLGFLLKPVTRVENACCSGSDAIRNAAFAVAAGIYETVLVIGAEKMRDVPPRASLIANRGVTSHLWMHPRGATAPQVFGQNATAHMHRYGTERKHFAEVAIKNHYYGSLNEKSALKFEVDLEKVLDAPIVSWPLGLFDCCPTTDGAAAVIITTEKNASKYTDKPVYLVGTGLSADVFLSSWRNTYTSWPSTKRASQEAFVMAGISVKDIDVAELHDCFSSTELITYEDLGFCKVGQAGPWIEEKGPYLEGEKPSNLSGGLKSKGHPVGATGIAQAIEIFSQLRGESGKRQVNNAKIGLTHNLGGTGSVSCVNIYRV